MNASIGFKEVKAGPDMDTGPGAHRGLHEILLYLARVHGPRYVVRYIKSGRATYFCGLPADVKAVLALGHRDTRNLLHPLLGNGLFTAETSSEHDRVKRIVSSILGRSRIGDFVPVLKDTIRAGVQKHFHSGGNFASDAMFHVAHSLSVSANCAFVFGADVPVSVVDAVSSVLSAVRSLITKTDDKTDNTVADSDPMLMLQKAKQDIRLHMKEMVDAPSASRVTPTPLLHDLSDRMLAEGYSEEDVFCELLSLLGSGLETTGATIFWAIYELTKNTEALRNLMGWLIARSTSLGALEERDTPLDHVISETLRLYPSGWVMYRRAPRDIVLDDGGLIPKSATACVSPFVTHRLFADWESPEDFAPSRFLSTGCDGRTIAQQYRFFPFGGGVHRCVGARLAMISISIILAELLGKYAISCENSDGIYSIGGLALEPKGDADFKVVRYGSV